MAPRRGRKPAKNETAEALINALNFIGLLKAPPAGSPVQYDYVFLNQGYAVGFDGVVAAGHPIPGDISGYPHAKLFAEALDNTDKTFTMTRRDDGAFEVGADKYTAIVPVCPEQVIATFPDNKQAPVADPAKLLAALKVAHAVTTDTGTVAAYSAIRLTDTTIMATNGKVMLEVVHGNNLPPVVLPRQFVSALLKTDKTVESIGLNGADWSTLTVWFSDGSWLRTNLFKGSDLFTEDMLNSYYAYLGEFQSAEPDEIPAKLWATVRAVMPWATENRVMLRPGIVQTHPSHQEGAALKLDKVKVEADIDVKAFLAIEDFATAYAINLDSTIMYFTGGDDKTPPLRGIMACLPLTPAQIEPQGGWDSAPESAGETSGGWTMAQNIAPPPDEPPARREAGPQQEWKGGPAEGLANDPEFLSQYHDQPAETFMVEVEDAYIFEGTDNGIDLTGMSWNEAIQEGFKPSGWLNTLTDDDAGLQE